MKITRTGEFAWGYQSTSPQSPAYSVKCFEKYAYLAGDSSESQLTPSGTIIFLMKFVVSMGQRLWIKTLNKHPLLSAMII
jgi:hypothetical protein